MANGAPLPLPTPLERILSSHIRALSNFIGGAADNGQRLNATQYTDAADYANKFGNVDTTNGYAAKFQYGPAATPTQIGTINKYGLQMGDLATPSALSTLVVSVTKSIAHVTANFGLVNTAAVPDSGAMRGIAATATGAGSIRAGEFHTLAQTGASAGGRYGIEVGLHSQVAGNGSTNHVGIYLDSSPFGLPTTVRNDTGVLITGSDGWTHGIRYLDTNGTSVLFNVNQVGTIGARHIIPVTANTYSLGDGTTNFAGVYFDTALLGKKVNPPATPGSGYSSLAPSTAEYWQYTTSAAVTARLIDTTLFSAAGQLPYASGSNAVAALAAGTSGQVLHGGTTPSWSAIATGDMAANAVTNRVLNFNETTNVLNGAAMTANVWLDVIANQNFTVANASSTVELICRAGIIITAGTVAALFSARLVIDSAGSAQNILIGSNILQVAGQFASPMTGNAPVIVTGLSAAVHTVKLQILSSITATAYCRASTVPGSEYVNMTAVEHLR